LPSPQAFDTSHALSAQIWSEGLEAEALKKISYTGMIGKRSDACIQWKDGLSKKPGDTETIGLRMQLNSAPKTSSDAVENNEQSLTIYNMDVTLDEVVDAVKFKNVIDRQRVTFDMLDEAKAALADQLANAWDTSLFNQVAGFDVTGLKATFRGNNAVTAPSTNHWILPAGRATENDITTGDEFILDYIDMAVEKAKTLSPSIRPARIEGYNAPLYVCFIHPYQTTSLRASDTRWDVLMRDAMQGGLINRNPLITGALGVWNGTLICESSRVPYGKDSGGDPKTDVRRAIFMGAQSAVMTWGRLGGDPRRFRWVEKQFDYDREYGVMAGFLGGIKKTVFNSADFSTIVISTLASAS
jgi:N4-gp56 family major capsid protein